MLEFVKKNLQNFQYIYYCDDCKNMVQITLSEFMKNNEKVPSCPECEKIRKTANKKQNEPKKVKNKFQLIRFKE